MSREPDGDKPLGYDGRDFDTFFVDGREIEPGGRPDWVESEPEIAAYLGHARGRVDRWRVATRAWTRPRFSYLELIGIYVVVTALVDLVWHRG